MQHRWWRRFPTVQVANSDRDHHIHHNSIALPRIPSCTPFSLRNTHSTQWQPRNKDRSPARPRGTFAALSPARPMRVIETRDD